MTKSPLLAAVLAALAVFAAVGMPLSAGVPGAAGPVTFLSLDHATGSLSLALPGRPPRPVASGDTLAVPGGVPVVVTVTGTNSALYTYSLAAEKGDAPQLEPLNHFLSSLAPFLVDIPATRIRAEGPDADPSQLALREIDEAIFGPAGVHRTWLAVEEALRKMSKGEGAILPAAEALRASLPPGWDSNVDRLLRAFGRLGSSASERKALQDSAKLLEAARRVESLAKSVLAARPEYSFPPFEVAWNESRALKIRVLQGRDSTLADFATLPPLSLIHI